MIGLLASELRKIWTVRTFWALSAIGWAIIALSAAGSAFASVFGDPYEGSPEQVAGVVETIGSNSVLVLVVALMIATTEFRHRTIGRTLQATPGRLTVLGAKLAAGVAYAVIFALGGLIVVAVVLAFAAAGGTAPEFSGQVLTAFGQSVAGLALTGVFGVAIGALIRGQALAITVMLVWVFVVENLFAAASSLLDLDIGRWLPFRALSAVFVPPEAAAMSEGAVESLSAVAGLSTFLAYVVVVTLLAAWLWRVRDV